ncbi:hypothetical protein GCM10009621_02000 [Corynebacterium felinum]
MHPKVCLDQAQSDSEVARCGRSKMDDGSDHFIETNNDLFNNISYHGKPVLSEGIRGNDYTNDLLIVERSFCSSRYN